MIPLRLEITNFLAFRQPGPLDFSGIHVAVLCGENGAGKSSLLDAITWAVWGRSRAKTDAELVHQGQSDMRVEYTFALGPHTYRIVRARKVGRGASSLLDFQMANGADGWTSISEATIPKTQEKIVRELRLTYETFINSAYLVQGNADEFTGRRPTERKQVLADILGLQDWERYEERAKGKMLEIDKRMAGLDALLREIESDLARRDEYQAELTGAQARVIEVAERLRQAEAGWAQIDLARQAMSALERQMADLARRIRDGESSLAEIEGELAQARLRADTTALLRELSLVQSTLVELDKLDAEREQVNVGRQVEAELAAQLRGQNEAARAEADVLKKRLEILQAATEPRCPTCGQALAEPARADLVEQLNQEVEARRSQYRENQAQLKKLADEQAALDRWLAQTATNLRGKPALIRKVADMQAAANSAEEARGRIPGLEERCARFAASLQADRSERIRLESEAQQHGAVLRDAAAKQRNLDNLRQEDTLTKARLGAAQQKLAALDGLSKQRETKRAERQALADERGLYEELREAFGKRGVPAMMIEAAVPEIEASANLLLSRMTSGRMHVRFNTQRETQGGEVRETLDIHIGDELGTRAYENYSVDGAEPVYIRRGGGVERVAIQDLWCTDQPVEHIGDGYELQSAEFDALCYQTGAAGWHPARSILRHPAPQEMLRLKLRPGNYSVTITGCHSVYVMTPQGLAVKRGDEVRPGDWVLTPRRIPSSDVQTEVDLSDWISSAFLARRNQNGKPLKWDEQQMWSRRDQPLNRVVPNDVDLAKLLGLAVAEASGRDHLTLALGNDRHAAEEILRLSNKLFGVSRTWLAEASAEAMARYVARAPGVSSIQPQPQFRPVVAGRLLAHVITNLIGSGAQNKRIPPIVFNAPDTAKLAFLKGLIAGDGYTRVRAQRTQVEVGITTVSPGLVADVIFLCRQLGIWARVEQHDSSGYRRGMWHRESYRISLSGGANLERLLGTPLAVKHPHTTAFDGLPLDLVGIQRVNGQRRLPRTESDRRFACGPRVVPQRSAAQYDRMLNWLQDWAVVEVDAVEKTAPTGHYVYDLVVPDNNSFVAGTGLILVHNSGGEQFRVNFAIRVALSQLLARRSGTQLQTLIMDEGFGVLDAAGRERLVEAIRAAENDFQRILVVTHIDELKDAFPVRIEIAKGPEGSSIQVR